MNLSKFFIDRPIFAGVISVAIFLAGLIAMTQLPISEYPEVVPPSVVVTALFPGANPETIADTVATPLEEQINGTENMLYMSSSAASDGTLTLTATFKLGTDPDLATATGAEPGQPGPAAPARCHPQSGRHHRQKLAGPDHGGASAARPTAAMTCCICAITRCSTSRISWPRSKASAALQLFGSGDYAMRLWLNPAEDRRAGAHRR